VVFLSSLWAYLAILTVNVFHLTTPQGYILLDFDFDLDFDQRKRILVKVEVEVKVKDPCVIYLRCP